MALRENNTSWDAVLHICLAQVWRILVVDLMVYLGAQALQGLTPVFYHIATQWIFINSDETRLIQLIFHFCVVLWALRQSLTDSYASFTLAVENKETGRSMYGLDKRLGWSFILPIWWAQAWRSSILTLMLVAGVVAAAMTRHQDPASYAYLGSNPFVVGFDLVASLIIAIWATHESLADRYRRFRIVTTPKTFYSH